MLPHSGREIKNQMRLHFYSGTSELLCRAVLLDRESLAPGESGYVQLRMESDTALCPGDRFVVRFYSPLETIGGGIILETDVRRERRFRPEVIERLRQREEGGSGSLLELQIRKHGKAMVTPGELGAETGLEAEELEKCLRELKEEGRIMEIKTKGDVFLWHAEAEAEVREEVLDVITDYLTKHPYRRGIPAAGFQSILLKCGKKSAAEEYAAWLIREGVLDKRGGLFFPAGYHPAEDRDYLAVKEKLQYAAEEAGYRRIRIEPSYDCGLEYVKGSLKSPYGLIRVSWKKDNTWSGEDNTADPETESRESVSLEVAVPANTSAVVVLPDGQECRVGSGVWKWQQETKVRVK